MNTFKEYKPDNHIVLNYVLLVDNGQCITVYINNIDTCIYRKIAFTKEPFVALYMYCEIRHELLHLYERCNEY